MSINLGIIGPGKIARVVVSKALVNIPDINLYAVASRNLEKAEQFANEFHFQKAYGSYEEMVSQPDLDLVYIATPHSFHYEHMLLCIKYHKNIICEKAFCVTKQEALDIINLARKENVFVTEALCTAYLPSQNVIKNIIERKLIGEVKSMRSVFGASLMDVERVAKKELGGGALLDLGVYPIYFTLSLLGTNYTLHDVQMKMVNSVDEEDIIKLKYPDNKEALIEISVGRNLGYFCDIIGTEGRLHIENFGMPASIELYDQNNKLTPINNLYPRNGYEYEFLSSINAIQNNRIETEEMPHQMTLEIMNIIERVRNFK